MANLEKTGRGCSRCGRRTKGHVGRYGPSCTLQPLTVGDKSGDILMSEMSEKDSSQTSADLHLQTNASVTGGNMQNPCQETFYTPTTQVVRTTHGTTLPGAPPVQSVAASNEAGTTTGPSTLPVYSVSNSTTSHILQAPSSSATTNFCPMVTTTATTLATTTMVNTQVGTFISTNQAVSSTGHDSQAGIHAYMPTWSTSAAAPSRLATHGWQPGAAVPNIDFSAIAQQLASLQAQLNNVQSMQNYMVNPGYSQGANPGQWQPPAPPGPPGWNNQWAYNSNVVCTAPQAYTHTHGAPLVGGVGPHVSTGAPPSWHQQPSNRHATGMDHLLVSGLTQVENMGDLSKLAPFEGIPDRTLRNAVSGMYVEIEHFIKPTSSILDDTSELHTVMDATTGHVSYKLKKPNKDIDNLFSWINAFLNYTKLMMAAHGVQVAQVMVDYVKHIMESERKYLWPCVYAFDIRHREAMSGIHVNFMHLDPTIVVSILDPLAVKCDARCLRCKSNTHDTVDCPLNKSSTNNALPPQSSTNNGNARHRSRSRGKSAKDICHKFNSTQCTYNPCRKQHVCIGCYGDLPFRECAKTGPCNRFEGNAKPPSAKS